MKKIYSFTIVVLILACLILSFCACDDAIRQARMRTTIENE